MFLCKWLSYFLTVTKGTGFDELQVVLLGHQLPEPGSRNLDTWGTWQGDVLRRRDDGRRTYWLWDARFCRLLFNYSYNGLRYWHGRRFRQPKELPSKASYERGTLAPWNPPQKLVVRGVYRHVRNPMITGAHCILLGEAIFFRSWWLLAWFGFGLILNLIYIPLVEERGLAKRLGDDYHLYKRNGSRSRILRKLVLRLVGRLVMNQSWRGCSRRMKYAN